MLRYIIGNDENEKGWCVCRVDKENGDAEITVVEHYDNKEDAWNGAWERNETYADASRFYIALCCINLEKGF